MRETERRGRILQIAAALTGSLMVALAGVLATAGLPGTSLSPASMPRPVERGGSIEPAPPSYLSIPRRGAQPYLTGVPRRTSAAPRPSASSVPPSTSGPDIRTSGEAGAGALPPSGRARPRTGTGLPLKRPALARTSPPAAKHAPRPSRAGR